ncbi:unnamed protein product [Rhizophagus irregularis]|nr:unnamed protein product [Rhizophagus irregularis]CAB5213799.1 unnamed protein product [Rhizophagus irregularis]
MSSGWQNVWAARRNRVDRRQVTEGGTCSREWIDRRIGIGNDAGVVPEAVAAVVAVAVAVAVAAAAVAIGGEEEEIEEEEKSLGCQSMGY